MIRACGRALALLLLFTSAAPALTLYDQTGRQVNLAAAPRRIISLVPSVTEVMFAIGAQDSLAGVTDFCDYPAEARKKPSVGGMVAPSLETMVALKPDLVIATTAGNREETFTQLERLRIPVYVVNPASVADMLDVASRLGAVTGHEVEARRLVTSLEARIKSVAERVAPWPRPRVLYVLWPDPLIVPGRDSIVSELIARAGGDSVTADAGEAYPRYSLESAVALAPQVIVLASHGSAQGKMSREKWERFRDLPAVKTGRLYSVDGNLLHRYGPRVVDGLELLARLFHPDAFPKSARK
ncbi:MAG TPA: cobalamin-binding protein [Methylomirabilota bacterium]|jgi:iron complex transport system substrate-binding protein|nr:cobalamin-binding protein [Methylomirabilota bacterium]